MISPVAMRSSTKWKPSSASSAAAERGQQRLAGEALGERVDDDALERADHHVEETPPGGRVAQAVQAAEQPHRHRDHELGERRMRPLELRDVAQIFFARAREVDFVEDAVGRPPITDHRDDERAQRDPAGDRPVEPHHPDDPFARVEPAACFRRDGSKRVAPRCGGRRAGGGLRYRPLTGAAEIEIAHPEEQHDVRERGRMRDRRPEIRRVHAGRSAAPSPSGTRANMPN